MHDVVGEEGVVVSPATLHGAVPGVFQVVPDPLQGGVLEFTQAAVDESVRRQRCQGETGDKENVGANFRSLLLRNLPPLLGRKGE